MSFLGPNEAEDQARLEEVLRQIQVPPFFLPLRGVGSFSAKGAPTVVWVGVGKGHPLLFALHKRIQDAVLRLGLKADLRPFHPHVTIGRTKGITKQALQPFLREHQERDFGLLQVEAYKLFSSELSPEGATHTIELRVPLVAD
jgi:2'-5' RNA ligase